MPQQSKVAAVGILLPLLILCLLIPGGFLVHRKSKQFGIQGLISSHQVRLPEAAESHSHSNHCNCSACKLSVLWVRSHSWLSVCSVCMRMGALKHASVSLRIYCCTGSSYYICTQVIIGRLCLHMQPMLPLCFMQIAPLCFSAYQVCKAAMAAWLSDILCLRSWTNC